MDPITDEEDVKYYLGISYAQEKDYRKAIRVYKEGLAINPQSVILLYETGLAYSQLRDERKALRYWKKLLRVASAHSYLALQVKQRLKRGNLLDKYEDNAVTSSHRT